MTGEENDKANRMGRGSDGAAHALESHAATVVPRYLPEGSLLN
jgi:hypothetical protein